MTRSLRTIHRWMWCLVAAATIWVLILAVRHQPGYPYKAARDSPDQSVPPEQP